VPAKPSILRPQDVAVALKIVLLEKRRQAQTESASGLGVAWTLAALAAETCLSIGEIHNAIRRLSASYLIRVDGRTVQRHNLTEFLFHGARYSFPPAIGGIARGVPTGLAIPAIRERLLFNSSEINVWPSPAGNAEGIALQPLYPAAPDAAVQDPDFYEMLALTDILRGDVRVRDRQAATEVMTDRLAR